MHAQPACNIFISMSQWSVERVWCIIMYYSMQGAGRVLLLACAVHWYPPWQPFCSLVVMNHDIHTSRCTCLLCLVGHCLIRHGQLPSIRIIMPYNYNFAAWPSHNLPQVVEHCKIKQYMQTKQFLYCASDKGLPESLSVDLEGVARWVEQNGLKLNEAKS